MASAQASWWRVKGKISVLSLERMEEQFFSGADSPVAHGIELLVSFWPSAQVVLPILNVKLFRDKLSLLVSKLWYHNQEGEDTAFLKNSGWMLLWRVVQGLLTGILSRRGRLQNFSSGSGLSDQSPEYKLWCLPEVIYYFSICFFDYFLFFYYEWVGIYPENVFKWVFSDLPDVIWSCWFSP